MRVNVSDARHVRTLLSIVADFDDEMELDPVQTGAGRLVSCLRCLRVGSQ